MLWGGNAPDYRPVHLRCEGLKAGHCPSTFRNACSLRPESDRYVCQGSACSANTSNEGAVPAHSPTPETLPHGKQLLVLIPLVTARGPRLDDPGSAEALHAPIVCLRSGFPLRSQFHCPRATTRTPVRRLPKSDLQYTTAVFSRKGSASSIPIVVAPSGWLPVHQEPMNLRGDWSPHRRDRVS